MDARHIYPSHDGQDDRFLYLELEAHYSMALKEHAVEQPFQAACRFVGDFPELSLSEEQFAHWNASHVATRTVQVTAHLYTPDKRMPVRLWRGPNAYYRETYHLVIHPDEIWDRRPATPKKKPR